MRRKKMSKKGSKKSFKKGLGVKSKNVKNTVMRGGIRL